MAPLSSPVSASMMASQLRLVDLCFAGEAGDTLVWLEGRGAQSVLMAQHGADGPRELSVELAIRGGVGYGGGELAALGRSLYLSGGDGRVYLLDLERGGPRPLTPAFGKVASPAPSPDGQHLLYIHHDGATDLIGAVDASGQRWPQQLVSGGDFYMQPAWHPDCRHIAWVRWDHPNMPWMGAWLELASVNPGASGLLLGEVQRVAGGDAVSVQQPVFSPDGRSLAYLSDEGGWLNLWVRDLVTGAARQLTHLVGEELGTPCWVQGVRTIGWLPDSSGLLAIRLREGVASLVRVALDGAITPVAGLDDYTALAQLAVSPAGEVALLASSSTITTRVVRMVPGQPARVIRRAGAERIPPERLSPMRPVRWRAEDGTDVFGLYYPPMGVEGPAPTLIFIHGGPTAQSVASWNVRAQYFATRGIGVLEVNYRGSTGYGRRYMEALHGQWGVVDVEDAVGGARHLVAEGLADERKLVIMGGSAGGYTVFQSLVTHPGFFAAGVALYGITNLFTLEEGTHKFESHYNGTLLGQLPGAAPIWRARSPIFHADKLVDPVAIFHGDEDRAVPIDQAEAVVKVLRERERPHLYHVYAGEGHGWRRPETIKHCYETILSFLNEHVLM
jgi:dipeptidyl aminopeptidase/acylaminoacyl peptidase